MADCIDVSAYIPADNPQAISDLAHEIKMQEQAAQEAVKPDKPEPAAKDPDDEVMQRIRLKLSATPHKPPKEVMPPYVPHLLHDLADDLRTHIEQTGLEVYDIADIQYGKKFKIRLGFKEADINLFYGRRGFSIVATPRRGTDAELNELAADLIRSYIATIT